MTKKMIGKNVIARINPAKSDIPSGENIQLWGIRRGRTKEQKIYQTKMLNDKSRNRLGLKKLINFINASLNKIIT